MTDLIVDNNSLQQLWRAGGASAWDTMLRGHDNIVILDAVAGEIPGGPHGADFDQWADTNASRVQSVDVLSNDWLDRINAVDGPTCSVPASGGPLSGGYSNRSRALS